MRSGQKMRVVGLHGDPGRIFDRFLRPPQGVDLSARKVGVECVLGRRTHFDDLWVVKYAEGGKTLHRPGELVPL